MSSWPRAIGAAWSSGVPRKKPVEEGGWNIFGTGWTGVETLEGLRTEWLKTPDNEARQEIAVKIQARAFETLPYIPTGQWSPVTAYRKNLKGVIIAPARFMRNVEKT